MFSLPAFKLYTAIAAFVAAIFVACTVAGGGERSPKNCPRTCREDINSSILIEATPGSTLLAYSFKMGAIAKGTIANNMHNRESR